MFRRILSAGAIVGLCLGMLQGVVSPAAIAAQGTPCAVDSEETITQLVTDFNTAFDAHDVAGLAALVSPDIVRDSPRGDENGVDEMTAGFEYFFSVFPDLSATVNLVLVDAPLAAIHYTTTGTQATTFAGTEPSGEPVTWDGMYLVHVECGKIDRLWSQVDQLSQRNQDTSTPATPVATMDDATPDPCPALTDESAATLMDAWYQDAWSGDVDTLTAITTPDVYHHWAIGPDSSGQAEQL
ncbi:MAG: ester cyclase, partial [Microvirga sp.]